MVGFTLKKKRFCAQIYKGWQLLDLYKESLHEKPMNISRKLGNLKTCLISQEEWNVVRKKMFLPTCVGNVKF